MNAPMQSPPHPAETWQKKDAEYKGQSVLLAMKDCGWLPPNQNIDSEGKIKLHLYKEVDECMLRNGYVKREPPRRQIKVF